MSKRREESSEPASRAKCARCGVRHRSITDDQCRDRAITEQALQHRVMGRAKRRGWTVAHVGKGFVGGSGGQFVTPMPAGWPDLFLLNRDVAPYRMALELKRELGVVDEKQWFWIELMKDCGIAAHIIRPSDIRSGFVNRLLEGR